jgi:KaiC/GvpD/RAD55 family RecA-like ATPase
MAAASAQTTRVSTGISLLDQILGGGISPGSLVCFIANPMSMAEVFLYQFASSRKSYYFTTIRRPEYVQRNIKDLNFKTDSIEFVNIYSMFNLKEGDSSLFLPTPRKNIYTISHHNAQRSTRIFTKSANMPKDMFWKFNFWSKEKALAVLGEIADKIFSEMMRVNERSSIKLVDADPQNSKFTLNFSDCDECRGLTNLKSGACSYHAGVFAGLFSSLLGQEFDAYETGCRATGNDTCVFALGPRQNADVAASLSKYLNPPASSTETEVLYFMDKSLKTVQKNTNIVVDTFSFFLEISESKEKVRQLLNLLYETTNKMECVTMLYLLKDTHPKEMEKIILNTCDTVFELETRMAGSEIETAIAIPKTRGVASPNKRVRVIIGERVTIDTSREIA